MQYIIHILDHISEWYIICVCYNMYMCFVRVVSFFKTQLIGVFGSDFRRSASRTRVVFLKILAKFTYTYIFVVKIYIAAFIFRTGMFVKLITKIMIKYWIHLSYHKSHGIGT